MATIMLRSTLLEPHWHWLSRSLTTKKMFTSSASPIASSSELPPQPLNTHYKITLRRSAISLGSKKQGTLVSLGLHRRMQTVYHRHSPEVAGKILLLKELVEVENVSPEMVKTKQEMRRERMASRGYQVVGNRRDRFMGI